MGWDSDDFGCEALSLSTDSVFRQFYGISYYEEDGEILPSASPAGQYVYPDLMEALLDVSENRETIAAEIAENKKWLMNEVKRRNLPK